MKNYFVLSNSPLFFECHLNAQSSKSLTHYHHPPLLHQYKMFSVMLLLRFNLVSKAKYNSESNGPPRPKSMLQAGRVMCTWRAHFTWTFSVDLFPTLLQKLYSAITVSIWPAVSYFISTAVA